MNASEEPKFGSPEWVLQCWEEAQENAAQREKAEATRLFGSLLESVSDFDLPEDLKRQLIAIFYEEIEAVQTGQPSVPADPAEERVRATFRRTIETLSPEVRQGALRDSPFSQGRLSAGGYDPGPPGDASVPRHKLAVIRKCGKCGGPLDDGPGSVKCESCGAQNRPPDESLSDEFDTAFKGLDKRPRGLIRILVDLVPSTFMESWGELEGLPDKELTETEYLNINDHDRAVLNRDWSRLGKIRSYRPPIDTRYELTKFFGSASRAKVFFTWVRIVTGDRAPDALRWSRCASCGGDLVYLALAYGNIECRNCGNHSDTTIYGDEKISGATPQSLRDQANGIWGFGAPPFSEGPEAEITRPGQGARP